MNLNTKRPAALIAAAVLLASTPLVAPAAADAAALKCRAHVSDSTPKQYTNVFVGVKTAPRAKVRTVAHYKTTDTPRSARANRKGRASTKYYISGATPGYRVQVDVKVTKHGRSKTCATSFKPHR